MSVRQRLHQPHENVNSKTNSKPSNLNNKNWWRVLNSNSSKRNELKLVEISEKVRDQVTLDVQRAFSFKNNSFSSKDRVMTIKI